MIFGSKTEMFELTLDGWKRKRFILRKNTSIGKEELMKKEVIEFSISTGRIFTHVEQK